MPDRPRPRPNNVGTSVRQRLLSVALERGQRTHMTTSLCDEKIYPITSPNTG